jgi:menaquinone-dependent protoporphyrinogen oxidase
VLVAYATKLGSNGEIAEAIADTLRAGGHHASAHPVREVKGLDGWDAVVLGSAIYAAHWQRDARRFVTRHRDALAERPVWLFSSGPLGTDLVDKEGRDIFETTRPKEFDELASLIAPRGERVFFGAWDPEAPPIGFAERFMRLMPATRTELPAGDYRDWAAIDAWADQIATALAGRST